MPLKIPYIRIKQRGEIFFVTKFRVDTLLKYIDFHFRDPYMNLQSKDVQIKTDEYIKKIRKQGIELQSSDEGIQRRLQYERIRNIADYLISDESNFLPNSILLSASIDETSSFFEDYLEYESKEVGYFTFPEDIRFIIIDGQHRLAGLSLLDEEYQENIEITTILLFNVSIPTAAKLFSDINGKQKPVNKSLIYDLYDLIGQEYQGIIPKFHSICESFYTSKKSPLYRQIKMLGIGSGAISQSFFIDYTIEALKQTPILLNEDLQDIYNHLFYYFRGFQKYFPDDWPVPLHFANEKELEAHAAYVLKERKSQLVKTNGFGAILRAFPNIYNIANRKYENYDSIIRKLQGKIEWATATGGTGKAFQNALYRQIIEIIASNN